MSDDAEWGPWVEHDGKGCPSILQEGVDIQARHRDGHVSTGRIVGWVLRKPNWVWPKPGYSDPENDVLGFRIRRPRALRDLIRLAAEPYTPPPVIGPDCPVRQPDEVDA